MRALRRTLDPAWIEAASAAVQARALALPVFAGAATVGCYLAASGEVQTGAVVEACRRAGKTVAVPAWREATGGYALARFDAEARMKAGAMGILEPESPGWVDRVELFFAPGVAFDAEGGRLGHGAGHIDRMLAGIGAGLVTVGLAFDCQIVRRVPMGRNDVRMDVVVTETRTFGRLAAGG
jgi:5-formyltetrahydrofolate cyclo-ligase